MSEADNIIALKPTENEWPISHCLTCHKELKRIQLTPEQKIKRRNFLVEYWNVEIQTPDDIICEYESCCGNWANVLFIKEGRGIEK